MQIVSLYSDIRCEEMVRGRIAVLRMHGPDQPSIDIVVVRLVAISGRFPMLHSWRGYALRWRCDQQPRR